MRIKKPLVVASLPIRTTADLDLIDSIEEADFIELRLDYMQNPTLLDPERLAKYRSKIIVTIRETSEGGVRAVDAMWKSRYLKRLYELGIMYDVEASYLGRYDVPYEGRIVSIHYINRLPTMEEVMEAITKYVDKAYTVKIAVKAFKGYRALLSSLLDIGYENLSLMPIAADPMERLAFSLLGSKLIYGYVSEPTAPGQLHYRDLIRILNCIFTIESENHLE
ncbi:MAG: type I 3-dehydroquinate dehydratase [Sulfolobales archaeon]